MIITTIGARKDCRLKFAIPREVESHAGRGVDEWLSIQGSAPQEWNPTRKIHLRPRRWSFTVKS